VTEWIPLPAPLAAAWWYALAHARWSLACGWREAFLSFAQRDAWTSAEDVEAFFGAMATPQVLLGLTYALRQEGVLLGRDAHQLDEALLHQMTNEGEWMHPRLQRRSV
jgi:hypothetical protein